MTRRRRSNHFRLAASAFLLVLLGGAAELGARAIGADLPSWRLVDGEGVVMTGHPTRLWGLSPGKKHNGEAVATVNALGMRGALPITPKPADRPRVLVVGDSTWFGHGVNDDETFPAQLAAKLAAAGVAAEVLNAGVPGYSTEQSRLFLEEDGFGLAPDLLVIGNLWSDNNVDSFQDEDLLATTRAARENPLFASYFFRLLATQVDRMRGGTGARMVTFTKNSQFPEKGGRRVSLQRYAENLDWMARAAAERGIGVAYIGPCNIGTVEQRYRDGASWDVFFAAQRAVAEHHGVPWIETVTAMRAAAGGGDASRLFVDVMHPSAEGHAIFATVAAEKLLAAGWPADRLVAKGAPFPHTSLSDSAFGVGDPNPASPQRNLFGPVHTLGPPTGDPITPDSRTDEGSAGGGPRKASGPDAGLDAGGVDTVSGRWAVTGTVVGGEGPLRIEARGPGGVAVASARLGAPGPFSLRVRADLDTVELVVTDAAGATATRTAAKGETVGEVALGR